MKPVRVRDRLAIRQALIAALLGLVLGVVLSALQVSYDYRESAEAERREITQMLAVMREPATQAAYQLSEAGAAVVVQGVLKFAPVSEAVLRSDFGETLAGGRNDPLAGVPDAWWTRFVAPMQHYGLALEYGPARKRVGELQVVAAQGPRVERFLRGVWRDLGLSILRSLVVALALGLLFYATLTRPLTAIAQRIGRAPAQAGPPPRLEAPRADEIGEIVEAFERYEREARERALSVEASAAALSASELRYRRVVETAGEGVWQVDAQGTTTLANEAMAQMLGTTVSALVGRSMFDFLDGDGQRAAQQMLGQRGGGNERRELRFVRGDGRELWAELSICPITDADDQAAGALAMVTDVTERRHRDEELRATNARLRAMVGDLERHKRDMAQIAELNELLQSARTEAEAFDVIRAAAARLFVVGSGGLSISTGSDEMVRVGAWGATAWVPPRYSRDSCWAIRRGGAHVQSPEHGVRCVHHPGKAIEDILCTPLYVEGKLIGVLHVAGESALDEGLRQRVGIFGEVIKLGLSNLRLRESLREQALRDPLTGLANRRLFDETLPRELARCVRSGQPLTVAVIDVDHFKHFNDSYGHEAGDRVLRAVAETLKRHIRAGDLASRWGGDEFMCLLAGLSAADARERFERALAGMAAGEGPQARDLPEPVSFTVGLATAPDCGTHETALLHAADLALYAAKARGRNCVEVASPVTPPAQASPG